MVDIKRDEPQAVVTNKAHGKMRDHAAAEVYVRDFAAVISDEPPSRGGNNTGPSPLEFMLVALCACINVSTSRMAEKIRFSYEDLEVFAEGDLDTRGRKGEADVPVHYHTVRVDIHIKTDEEDKRMDRLADLVARYCPVDSFYQAAVPNYHVKWHRMA
ncbi:MAG: OsmC family protein [Chloroflexota bacterium]